MDLADLSPVSDVTDRVRVELPSGSYVLVAEAVDANGSAEAAIYGVATAVIRVE